MLASYIISQLVTKNLKIMKKINSFLIVFATITLFLQSNLFAQCGSASADDIIVPVECYEYGMYYHNEDVDIQFTGAAVYKFYHLELEKVGGNLSFSCNPVLNTPNPPEDYFAYDPINDRYICLASNATMSIYFTIDEEDLHPADSAELEFSWQCYYKYNNEWLWSDWESINFIVKPEQPTYSGPSLPVCYSSSRTYSISDVPEDVSYMTVSVSPNLVITGGSSSSVNVRAKYSYSSGEGWIYPTYVMDCSYTLDCQKKYVWVGKHQNTWVAGTVAVCPQTNYTYTAMVWGDPESYEDYAWTYPGNWSVQGEDDEYAIQLLTPQYPDYGTVRVSVKNDCGWSDYSGVTVYPGYCGGYMMALPNPADNYIDIDIDEKKLATAQKYLKGESVLKMYDKMGTVKYTAEFKEFPYRINTSVLPEGLYVILIINNERAQSIEVIVEH